MTGNDSNRRSLAVPSGRFARASRLGSMTAGVAGSMALQGLGELGRGKKPALRSLLLTPQNVSRVTKQLAEMRGAAMKIGQLLSMDAGDFLPPELSAIMARLRDDAYFMPPTQLKKVLNKNWPKGWIHQFRHFDVTPLAAASIGQVHRAKMKDGRDMAIKVQYPGVAQSIDSDVANVGTLMRMSGLLPKGFDLAPYLKEARHQLHDETDYFGEGNHLSAFRVLLGSDDRFELPHLYTDWTTGNILAMSYVAGTPIEATASYPQDVRDKIVSGLIELLLKELFEFGLMQTDPNFANYLFDPDTGRIVLLDFGATRVLDHTLREKYRSLMRAGFKGDLQMLNDLSLDIGFFDPDTEDRHRDLILNMMSMIFAQFNENEPFDFGTTDLSRRMHCEGTALAEQGFVPPPVPIDVLLLQRKFGGMFLLASKLKARVNVKELLTMHV